MCRARPRHHLDHILANCGGQIDHRLHGKVLRAVLDGADIGLSDPGEVCQLILSEPCP